MWQVVLEPDRVSGKNRCPSHCQVGDENYTLEITAVLRLPFRVGV